jgi:mannose-6-phosphate isomerase-like protein (cupin superfamily)
MTDPVIDRDSAEHYRWGDVCDGWHLVASPELSVIEERVPPGAGEVRHLHRRARQLFYVLEGSAALEIEGIPVEVGARQAVEIPPGAAHRLRNAGEVELVFLVVSAPPSHGDRVLSPEPSP